MPYNWTTTDTAQTDELRLWPHQSLPQRGFALFIGLTFAMLLLPLLAVLGTMVLWGLLPFLMLAVWAIWAALRRSRRDRQILEVLTLSPDLARLVRHNPRGEDQEWQCNRYWTTPELHPADGPVPHYVTLRGCGREVEIGAFLSEAERMALYRELSRLLR